MYVDTDVYSTPPSAAARGVALWQHRQKPAYIRLGTWQSALTSHTTISLFSRRIPLYVTCHRIVTPFWTPTDSWLLTLFGHYTANTWYRKPLALLIVLQTRRFCHPATSRTPVHPRA